MPDTFQYKVRDRAGNVTSGSLIADSEALVLARLREQGFTPLDVKRQKKGIGQIEFGGEEGQAQAGRGLLTPVRHDGQLGTADPARDRDPRGPERQQGAVAGPQRGASRRGAGVVAVGRDGQARPRLQQPVRLDGEVGRDRRLAGHDPPAPGRDDRARGTAARQDQVGDDLPGRRRRPRHPDHVGDAAVRRPAVRGDLRSARRARCRSRPAACSGCRRPSRPTGTSCSEERSARGSSSADGRRPNAVAR